MGNEFFINNVWPCSKNIDINSSKIVSGRYLTEDELKSDNKVAVIGSGMERLVEEKDGERYIKIFEEEYKVVGIIADTIMFRYSSIIPIKSLYCINKPLPKYTFLVKDIDKIETKNTGNKNMKIDICNIPKTPVVDYLFKKVSELKNSLYQILLGITNLFLFSYFFSKRIKEKVAIMKILGGTNIDIFKEVFFKFIKISSMGVVGGILLSKFVVDFMRISFPYDYSIVDMKNILITTILVFIISVLVSISVLFNVLKFKIMKEIR